jgi:flagellar biosynthesis protein FlhB
VSEARTEEATPKRERKAREEGRAWQSRDLVLGAVLVTSGAGLAASVHATRDAITGWIEAGLARATSPEAADPRAAIEASVASGVSLAWPWLVAMVVAAAVVSSAQVRGLFAPGAVAPDLARLDPSGRGPRGARLGSTALLGLARLASLAAVSAATIVQAMPGVATLSRQPPSAALDACLVLASTIALRSGLVLVAIGVVDAIVERTLFRASLRMTRREREREQREAEGEPHVRRERERLRGELHRADDLEETRAARIVIDDGEATLVALAWDETDLDAVPRVAAIGRDARAGEMRDVARETGVPRTVDEGLATSLAALSLGASIPETLYDAVARAMHVARA